MMICFYDYRTGYKSMKWLMLSVAGVFEIVRAVTMKYPQGFSQPVPSVITAAAFRFRLCHAGGVRHNRHSFFRSHVF